MRLQDLFESTGDLGDCAVTAMKAAKVRHAQITNIEFDGEPDGGDTDVLFSVMYEFPEHFVPSAKVKAAGKPCVKKCSVSKSEQWKEGMFGADYVIVMNGELTDADKAKIKGLKD